MMENKAQKKGERPCKPKQKSTASDWAFVLDRCTRSILFRRDARGKFTPTYAVRLGDTFYDDHGGFGRQLKKGGDATLSIQVVSAKPGEFGEVKFELYRATPWHKYQWRKIGSATCTQKRFLRILRDGVPGPGY